MWEEFPGQGEWGLERETRTLSGQCDPGQSNGEGWRKGEDKRDSGEGTDD